MKLEDCITDISHSMMAPLLRREPEEVWDKAFDKKQIPESLYRFYIATDYFSLDKCPLFLADDRKMLFAHLERSANLIRLSFEEYHELIDLMKDNYSHFYFPGREKEYGVDHKYQERQFDRNLQIFIINMYSILDSVAETIAVLTGWGKVGRAGFSQLVVEVRDNESSSENIVAGIEESSIDRIKYIIRDIVIVDKGNEKQWYEIFKLYRNKSSHFRTLSTFCFHDKKGEFYRFLPRQWPYYFQQDIKETKRYPGEEKEPSDSFEKLLMKQDIFEYCEGLHNKLYRIADEIFQVLLELYKIKKETKCNIYPDLKKQSKAIVKKYDFEYFS